jgi:hypothetical protein
MAHHLNFLMKRKRYAKAWQEVLNGDPAAYSHELKAGGYYTANEARYTNTLVNLFNEYVKKKAKLLAWEPPIINENADTDPSPPPDSADDPILPPPPPIIEVDEIPIPDPEFPEPILDDDEPDTIPYRKKPRVSKGGIGIVVAILVGVLGVIGSCL